jgi:hypothetical protein
MHRSMMVFDTTAIEIGFSDLVLDRAQHLPARLFRQLDLRQVNALLWNHDDNRIRVLRRDGGQIALARGLPDHFGAARGFLEIGPAEIREAVVAEMNQQAHARSAPGCD